MLDLFEPDPEDEALTLIEIVQGIVKLSPTVRERLSV